MFSGMYPASRPRLPRWKWCETTAAWLAGMNWLLDESLSESSSLMEICDLVYCGAVAIGELHGKHIEQYIHTRNLHLPKQVNWFRRLSRKIEKLRQNIARLEAATRTQLGRRAASKCKKIRAGYSISLGKVEDKILIDHLKLKLAALVKRRRRYEKNTLRKINLRKFESNERSFYRHLRPQEESLSPDMDMVEVHKYWAGIWSTPAWYNCRATWLKQLERECNIIPEMPQIPLTVEEIRQVICRTKSWKSPGPDAISNFWYKKFTSTHRYIADAFQRILSGQELFPTVLCEGKTTLLPKKKLSDRPEDTRPITCLPTIYKVFTSIMAARIQQHVQQNGIMAFEQRGCAPGGMGCKEHLTIDAVLVGEATHKRKDLFMAYIDYRKAFDSVPHSWLLSVLRTYKVDPRLIRSLNLLMSNWRTRIVVERNVSESIDIRRGVFQGDAISPLLFCLALNPLSTLIKQHDYGYVLGPADGDFIRVNHLLYVDDLKLLARSEQELHSLLELVATFSKDICMTFGFEKCNTFAIVKGKCVSPRPLQLNECQNEMVRALEQGQYYKYLGFSQARGIAHKQIKEALKIGFKSRLTAVMASGVTGRALARAINTYAVPLLNYSFGIIKWSTTELQALNRLIRTQMSSHRKHHPRASVVRVNLPRGSGGRGIVDVQEQAMRQARALRVYFQTQSETSLVHRIVCGADETYTPLLLANQSYNPMSHILTDQERISIWMSKPVHGKHLGLVLRQGIDRVATWQWLTRGSLYAETEGFMIAIQDGVLPTRNYLRHVQGKQNVEDKCRRCGARGETIEHIIASCPVLAPIQYLKRHNLIGIICYRALATVLGMELERQPYYRYDPPVLLENENHKLYWDKTIPTDMVIPANRPDIIWIDKQNRKAWIIDIALPLTANLYTKYAEKVNKYQALATEIKVMWDLEAVSIVPLILSATGVVPSSLAKGLTQLKIDVAIREEMQKAALLQTCNIVRRFLGIDD